MADKKQNEVGEVNEIYALVSIITPIVKDTLQSSMGEIKGPLTTILAQLVEVALTLDNIKNRLTVIENLNCTKKTTTRKNTTAGKEDSLDISPVTKTPIKSSRPNRMHYFRDAFSTDQLFRDRYISKEKLEEFSNMPDVLKKEEGKARWAAIASKQWAELKKPEYKQQLEEYNAEHVRAMKAYSADKQPVQFDNELDSSHEKN